MRRMLDALYDAAVWLAAAMMVGVLAMVLLSIAGRQLHFHVPGTDAYAGYLMAGAGFLSLAHTLRRGEHIRVTLLLQAVRGAPRRALEVWSLTVATALAATFAFYSIKLTWQSRVFNDVSTSSDATPLWIPQISMAVGATLFAIALFDQWVQTLRGRADVPAPGAEPLRNE
jgi:TRAP-type C4-dicarboxylate transport system permease small subunit